jgi:predicted nucleic acid-binding protein
VIFLDTSLLIDSLTGSKDSGPSLRRAFDRGERILLSSITLYEWLRGPRTHADLAIRENLFPTKSIVHFDAEDAAIAGRLYRSLHRPKGREIDIMIAACAIRHDAELWTLNAADFKDIPGLRLIQPK